MTAPALTKPIDGEAYMRVLLERQAAWTAAHPDMRWSPLLEWFIAPGDEKWVVLPEATPEPKRTPTPRAYRPAAEIRAELEKVDAQMAVIAGNDSGDRAEANLSPYSRSRAARNAGRRRFAQMDRDLARYAALSKRRHVLAGKLAVAESREQRQDTIADPTAPREQQ